jgi:hypothetical protein
VRHHIAFNKRYAPFRITSRSASQQSFVIDVNSSHTLAMPCKLSREQTVTATDVERTLAIRRN